MAAAEPRLSGFITALSLWPPWGVTPHLVFFTARKRLMWEGGAGGLSMGSPARDTKPQSSETSQWNFRPQGR